MTATRTASTRTWRGPDGSALIGVGGLPRAVGRGLVVGDFANDGTPDIAVNTVGGRLQLLRSTGAQGHWLEVRLAKFSPGAVVTAVLPDGRRLVREEQIGSSYLSSQDPRLLFGLGAATTVTELDVRYPGGAETHLANLAADRIVTVRPAHTVSLRRTASPTSYLIPGCTRTDLHGYAANIRATFDELVRTVQSLCYRIDFTSTKGNSPAALGNRIATAVTRYGEHDGALESRHYIDESYTPVNAPLVVASTGTGMHDPTLWQPLALAQTVAQNGLALPAKVQTFVGAQWGHVRGFAVAL